MSPGATMERVYLDLKARIVAGAYPPGARLDPAHLASSLAASATPVRDALHRLSGERLVDAWHQEGFRQPMLAEADLHDLYGWSASLLILALRGREPEAGLPDGPAVGAGSDDYAGEVARLFRAIALRSDNRELRHAIVNMVERCQVVRAAELRADPECRSSLAAMEEDFRFSRLSALRAKVTRFHRRRVAYAGRTVAELRPRAQPLG